MIALYAWEALASQAAHLRRRGLRTFSSPLDWVVSLSLTDVNLLLSRRFPEYMELPNEVPDEGDDVFVENEVVILGPIVFYKRLLLLCDFRS